MFISRQYAEKMWPNVERRAAMARSIKQKTEYILPVRLDNTDLEGLLPTINYLSYREYGADGIVEQLLMKLDLGKEGISSTAQPSAAVKSLSFHLGFGRGHAFGSVRSSQDESLRTAEQVAESLWKRFTARLEA